MQKRGPGRPPNEMYRVETLTIEHDFWRVRFEVMLNTWHGRGYRLEKLINKGGNELVLVWAKRDAPRICAPVGDSERETATESNN